MYSYNPPVMRLLYGLSANNSQINTVETSNSEVTLNRGI
jgi:hypothetical protein